ncbi:type IV pilus biogenesis protein PilM [Alkalibacillus aidingensis]|uniref:type IV pilus biogenesis protein PilM n=1 Tax=Alkalibacillus aidingensis TaxID=2747607 RepID=UPI0016602388|nr:pilus assembly protein PilM [Alkalibacillus aidingensis]
MGKKHMINLEIRDYVIRYIEPKKGSSNEVERMGEHFLPSGVIVDGVIEEKEAFKKIIQTCAKKWRLKRKSIRLSMPDSLVFIRKQMIPLDVPKDEVEKFINFNLGETIHLPFEESIFETVYIRQLTDQHEVSLISTDRGVVDQYVELLDDVGLKVKVVDISPLNYYRIFYHQDLVSEEDRFLLIQYHIDRVIFSAFVDHTPIFLQEFDLDSSEMVTNQLGPTMSKEDFNRDLVMEEFEEMNIEVERVERFYQMAMNEGEQRFSKIAIVGDHPFLDQMIDRMEEGYETPIVYLDEDQLNGPKGMSLESKFHNVYGLALKGER